METLAQRMERLRILETDLVERFVLGSGNGGQKINKTSSCVWLKHLPSGLEVRCQDSRFRERNRELARERLCDHMETNSRREALAKARKRALTRFRHRKPSEASTRRRLDDKKRRAEKKRFRSSSDH